MDIKIDKLISGSNGTLACVSDETILDVGKRYFELASGKDKQEEAPRPDTAVDIINKAKDIKVYCNKRGSCKDCPLFVQDGMVFDCVFKCAPGDWEV